LSYHKDVIEEWRAERKKKAELLPVNFALPSKKWTLEDDDEDDEEEPSQKLGENEEDALDAFMQVNYMHINLSVLVYVYRHFQQYFSYIVAVSVIGGGNPSTRRKPSTCRKSPINFMLLYRVHLA
jgi:hypothetical protein